MDEHPGEQQPNSSAPVVEPRARIPSRYIHSDIYDRLVDDEDDLTGLVAYGLYQAEKRRWIQGFEDRKQETPSEEQVQGFCSTYDDPRLIKLREESEGLIFRVTEERITERIEQLSKAAFNVRAVGELGELKSAIRDISGYKHHVIAHLISFALLVGIYYFITFAANHEPTIKGPLTTTEQTPPQGGASEPK